MFETASAPVATDYLGKTVTVRNAKFFNSVMSGTCVLVTLSATGVNKIKMEGLDWVSISDGSEYASTSEYYWNIESVL